MPTDQIKSLEDEVEALKLANDGLYKQHANEKAQMQLAIEQEKLRVSELIEANAAYRDENEQWRVSYEALENHRRECDERYEVEKRELEEKVSFLEESVKSYTTELVSDLEELEKDKAALATREETIVDLQRQIDDSNTRFTQLTSEYDTLSASFEQMRVDKTARDSQYLALEATLRDQITQLEYQVSSLNAQVKALSQDGEANNVNQLAELAKARQDADEKGTEIESLNRKITQLEEEISLLSLTVVSSDGKSRSDITATLRDLQQQVFQKSEELVQQGEKHLKLAEGFDKITRQHQELKQEISEVRHFLLRGIIGDSVDVAVYQHVKLDELIRLRLKGAEHEAQLLQTATSDTTPLADSVVDAEGGPDLQKSRPPTHLANVETFSAMDSFGTLGRLERELRLARSRNKRQQDRIEQLEREINAATSSLNEFQALKEKMVDVVGRERVEKELRAKAESGLKEATEKIAALSEHIEKLMVHLKHEAAAKTKAVDIQRRTEKELIECKDKLSVMTKKNALKDTQIQELEHGAKILEDQLRLMDEKFIEIRNKLDWTRATSQKETKRLQNELSSLRMKWQMASDAGILSSLPDWGSPTQFSKKSTKPLGASASEPRLVGASNNSPAAILAGGPGAPLSPLAHRGSELGVVEDGGGQSRRPRFEIPKLPQQEAEAGTPWSDAKLSVLQRQFSATKPGGGGRL